VSKGIDIQARKSDTEVGTVRELETSIHNLSGDKKRSVAKPSLVLSAHDDSSSVATERLLASVVGENPGKGDEVETEHRGKNAQFCICTDESNEAIADLLDALARILRGRKSRGASDECHQAKPE